MAKPAGGTALDTGHALYTSMSAAWGLLTGSGNAVDSKGSNTGTVNHASWSTDANGDACLSVAGGAATVDAVTLASAVALSGGSSAKWSIAWGAQQAAANNNGMIWGNTGTTDFGWHVGGTSTQFRLNSVSPITFAHSASSSYKNYLLTFDDTDSHNVRFYVNGTEDASSPIINSSSDLNFDRLMSGFNSTSLSYEGKLSYMYVWSGRTLTGTDAGTLNSNPYVVFTSGGGGGGSGKPAGYYFNQQQRMWGN